MLRPSRMNAVAPLAAAAGAALALSAWEGPAVHALPAPPNPPAAGYPIHDEAVIRNCGTCHLRDEEGRMGRLSFMRKTPEGWQESIRRMVSLHGARLEPAAAREVLRYLANHQGIAPAELEEGRFEVERRMVEYVYEDREIHRTCAACHSMGRIITQRRTREEWQLLVETHRALYPLVDRQTFRNFSPPPPGQSDRRHPAEKAVDHFAQAYPLDTPEWAEWAANLRPARLEGSWALEGHDPAQGPFFGTVTIRAVPGTDDEFTHEAAWTYAEGAPSVRRSGRGVVYTGYQWRGRSTAPGTPELREVLTLERGWDLLTGRWFTGDHDELGMDVTLRRITPAPLVSGVHPPALRTGTTGQELRIHGANLPSGLTPRDVALGRGVQVRAVHRPSPSLLVLRVDVDADAPVGRRDLQLPGASRTGVLAVYDRIHAIRVVPDRGMARIGGVVHPKRYVQFEAVGWHYGPDGRPDTPDDLPLGRVPVAWSLEEFPHTLGDDDVDFVGEIDARGFFTPAPDGPNPHRSGERNNVGNVWVVATHRPAGEGDDALLRARAHLLVTVPVYLYFDAWPERPPPDPAAAPPVGSGSGGEP